MVHSTPLYKNEWYKKKVSTLLETLEIIPKSLDHYLLSFVHRSLVNERPDFSAEHNERLEFLGDAVLELVITSELYHDFPDTAEGVLTDYRSTVVKGKHLASVARSLHLPQYMILGKGEEKGGGRNNDYLLANCMEAFLGALYLDNGYERCKVFILLHIYSHLDEILKSSEIKECKTLFQEYTQARFGITPEYRILRESGCDHEKSFVSGVFLGETQVGEGQGSSKKKSQESAACHAYENRENIEISTKPQSVSSVPKIIHSL